MDFVVAGIMFEMPARLVGEGSREGDVDRINVVG
jgi:hypothetical protein